MTKGPRQAPASLYTWRGGGPGLLTAAGAGLWVLSLRTLRAEDLTDIGLAPALPIGVYAGVAAVIAAFAWSLAREQLQPLALAAQLIALVVMLHGVTAAVEPLPRFPTAWLHAGFADSIARTGETLKGFDARFSWPGFFSLTALVSLVAGLDSPLGLLRWHSVLFNLAVLLPLWSLTATSGIGHRGRWLALWLFVLGNWIGQDYLSPQATAFFLYLVVMAVLLRWFGPDRSVAVPVVEWSRRGWAVVRRRSLPPAARPWCPPLADSPPPPAPTRVALVVLLVAMAATVAMSHQLTPFFLLAGSGVLALAGFQRLRALPILIGVLTVGWISFGAADYWTGHLDEIIGGVGQVGSAVGASTAARFGSNRGHMAVLSLRLAITAASWVLAVVGFRRWKRADGAARRWPPALLAITPFGALGLQSYGGEVLLRVQLFALPFMAILGAMAVFPGPYRRDAARPLVLAVVALSVPLTGAFFIARYGNERFEYVSPAERDGVAALYRLAPPGSTLFTLSSNAPFRHMRLEQYSYDLSLEDADLFEPGAVVDAMLSAEADRAYLLVTRTQEAYLELSRGFPAGWTSRVVGPLEASGELRLLFANDDARVLVLDDGATP